MKEALETIRKFWPVLVISLVFAALNTIFLVKDIYYITFLPVAIVIGVLLILNPRLIFLFIAFVTPLSFLLNFQELNVSLHFPTEPLLFFFMIVYLVKVVLERPLEKRLVLHPISLIIIAMHIWILVTSFTSEMPLVSFKFWLSRVWYITVFYFVALHFFRRFKNIRLFLWLFIISMVMVICYTVFQHQQHLFSREASNFVMKPFFKDHTIYGAVLALIFPALVAFVVKPRIFRLTSFMHGFSILFLVIFMVGIIFSYTRAAWVSIVISLGVLIIFLLKIKFRTIVMSIVLVGSLIYVFRVDIIMFFKENEATSANDFSQHIKSIYNITNDASNTERINRWTSAIRMFEQRPIVGWGPGTYTFQYAPFQMSYEKTEISTNFGELGNAHSEYLGPLAEQGLPGALFMLSLIILAFYRSMHLVYHGRTETVRVVSAVAILCLVTYYTHGLLNNFLDIDKAAVPFWAFHAIITIMDVVYNREEENDFLPADAQADTPAN